MKIMCLFIPDGPFGDSMRGKIWKPYIKQCGKNFKVASNAYIYNPNGLVVGDNVYIGFCTYLGQGEIILENEVIIGNHVSITASNHLRNNESYRFGGYESKTITIGSGSWIAAHSCVLAGSKIGNGCLVAAGSIVTNKCFENNLVIAGIPAKKIKVLNKNEK
eukprot:Anaeramoba_ignava/a91425_4.p1 GENE.a91425_4~~a91425_4.p1  ORF type:complete len:162 (-),score=3.75 a91425_4:220-705(-)